MGGPRTEEVVFQDLFMAQKIIGVSDDLFPEVKKGFVTSRFYKQVHGTRLNGGHAYEGGFQFRIIFQAQPFNIRKAVVCREKKQSIRADLP